MEFRSNQLTSYWNLSFKLWFIFCYVALKNCFRLRRSGVVEDTESLGRALFSGHVKKGRIQPSAFMPKRGSRALSVNRLSHAPHEWFMELSQRDASRRAIKSQKIVNFYGFATIRAQKLRGISFGDNMKFSVRGTPTFGNPLHADIVLPPDEGKDLDLAIVDALLENVDLYQSPSS
jgi:hypothetical protein